MSNDDMFREGPKLGRGLQNEISVLQQEGMSGASLGERLPRAQDFALTRPETQEVMDRILFKRKNRPRPPVRRVKIPRNVRPEEVAKGIMKTMEIVPNDLVISNFRVGTGVQQIDTGLSGRTDIIIANMSTNVVWVNTSSDLLNTGGGISVGIPLSPASGAATYDGGTWRARISPNKRWWAVATGVNSLVVVVELARR